MRKILLFLFTVTTLFASAQFVDKKIVGWKKTGNALGNSTSKIGSTNAFGWYGISNSVIFFHADSLAIPGSTFYGSVKTKTLVIPGTVTNNGFIEMTRTGLPMSAGAVGTLRIGSSTTGQLTFAPGSDAFRRVIAGVLTAHRTYTLQDGDGVLAFVSQIPNTSTLVPYTGATGNVILGTNMFQADGITLGSGSTSILTLSTSTSGKILQLVSSAAGFNEIDLTLGSTGSVSQLNTNAPAWTMNQNLRFDNANTSNIYVNNGGNGLRLNGRNDVSGAFGVTIADDGKTGIKNATPLAYLHVGSGASLANREIAYISQNFTATAFGSQFAVRDATTTAAAGSNASIVYYDGNVTTPATGTNALITGVRVGPFVHTAGGATVTETSAFYVTGSTVGGTSNYAMHVAAGVARFDGNVTVQNTTVVPTAKLHLGAGTAAASTAPFKYTSGVLLTTPEAGAKEFLTDKEYVTITTGAARKEIALNDIALTSGRVPFATTNGRLTDLAGFTYSGTRLSPTYITLAAGTAAAGTAPIVMTSGPLLTTPVAGSIGFLTDDYYVTITTGAARHKVTRCLTGNAILDFPNTTAQSANSLTLTVTGAADGDAVSIGSLNASNDATNTLYTAWVSAADVVTIKFANNNLVTAVNPPSGRFNATVFKN